MPNAERVVLLTDMEWSKEIAFRHTNRGIYINSAKKCELPFIQLTKVGHLDNTFKVPFGISQPFGGGTGRSSMEIELEGDDVVESIQKLDSFIINCASEENWFGKDKTLDDITRMYLPACREPNTGKSRSTLRVKVANDATKSPEVYVSSGWDEGTGHISVYKAMSTDVIQPHTRVIPIIELSPRVWHMPENNQFGITFTVSKLIVFDDPSSSRGKDAFDL